MGPTSAPQLVIETTSKNIKLKDLKTKPEIEAHIGVHEDFLYDPTLDYLDPPLQGQRGVDGHYQAIPIEPTGGLYCEKLGMGLRFESSQLQFFHRGSQDRLSSIFPISRTTNDGIVFC
jgi:Uma2 family endonuclease